MGRLNGKVALISGAARGQGAHEARLFVAEGASVVIGDVLADEGRALADELGASALFVELDVTSEASWTNAVRAAESRFGRLDILVNNAGILRRATIEESSVEEFDRVIAVNQRGVFLGMKAAVRLMKRTGGSIVNISSTAGMKAAAGHVAYVGSKFAVRGMTKVAAIEFAKYGIRVNSVHPGLIGTDMIRDRFDDAGMAAFTANQLVNRPGTVEDVANLVLFLASDDSAFSTGAEFMCDGGYTVGTR
ncbi:SDR family oxidoreductase [Alsobacter sp. SYSU M60028]|uniref:SDR family oxidoreductase n=1 Tax=Alsobacter ponti TaxID=2962936 RepID=A0ABT1LET6_9HYPH|nr:glucose 1-dehydrogenase [Alsobacter ponti]MCP8939964.1 SDR family oxidoreductase [Alsobacter ponti]